MDIETYNYYGDHRVIAGMTDSTFKSVDQRRMVGELVLGDRCVYCELPDSSCKGCTKTNTVEVPIVFEVCSTCRGKGTHTNPAIDCCGISSERFAEDPDFAEDYFGGVYDVPCNECHGNRVAPAIDYNHADKNIIKEYERKIQADIDYAMMCAAERRLGA